MYKVSTSLDAFGIYPSLEEPILPPFKNTFCFHLTCSWIVFISSAIAWSPFSFASSSVLCRNPLSRSYEVQQERSLSLKLLVTYFWICKLKWGARDLERSPCVTPILEEVASTVVSVNIWLCCRNDILPNAQMLFMHLDNLCPSLLLYDLQWK